MPPCLTITASRFPGYDSNRGQEDVLLGQLRGMPTRPEALGASGVFVAVAITVTSDSTHSCDATDLVAVERVLSAPLEN